MSRLKALLRVATPSPCNKQQTVLPVCTGVAQPVHGTQQRTLHVAPLSPRNTQQRESELWREFETLLAIVAPAYNTPAHELDEIREAARNDIASALIAYRLMAKEMRGDSK